MHPMKTLSHLVQHEDARLTGTTCTHCRRRPRRSRSYEAASRAVSAGTPAGAGLAVLPGWSGWSAPVTLTFFLEMGARFKSGGRGRSPRRVVPRSQRPFFVNGHALYRISQAGNPQPITIGQVRRSKSVWKRVREHLGDLRDGKKIPGGLKGKKRLTRSEKKIRAALLSLDSDDVLIQMGTVDRGDLDTRIMHAYEIWLQKREGIRLYEPDTTTFEDFEAEDDELLFDVA